MEPTKRTRLSPDERRAQLIDLGVHMLTERPLEQISVDDIADRAGVSRGLLFHYFGSKHDYHVAIVRHTSADMLARTAPNLDLEPIEILRDVMASYIDYVSENRDTYVSLLRGTASGDPAMREVFEQTRAEMARRVVDQLPTLGIDPTPRIALSVRGWIAFVEEATITWLRDPEITRDDLVELLVTALPAVALSSQMAAALLGT
ncbi:TetR/AcrR family transcriptional regulator [Prescottella sp. R16]|uniref:TetR/AcrR family transcriptional regulator n=1 Tax=Prescottella sp. R16 TaxID=3064529 RepID=UPI00272E2A61|nr:TetR/AcrR family transcriptional regulator [Prescottella sp. R16]